jgi:MSHA biogenesis protein MshQ
MQFQLNRVAPSLAGSANGTFQYSASPPISAGVGASFQDVTLNSFSNGVSLYNAATYSEVGVINLDVQDSNYGNAGITIPASSINIGRFVPHYFTQTVADNGVLTASCGLNTGFFAYSGQRNESNNTLGAISYLSNPIMAITAFNKQGNITQNYFQDTQGSANDFMKLRPSDISIAPPSADQVATGVNGINLPVVANLNAGIISQNDLTALPNTVALPRGVLHYQLSDADNFYYVRSTNALVSPFIADIDMSVANIVDPDNVSAISTQALSPTGLEIRFGRQVLENSFGPETSNFPQIMSTEHFDTNRFITSLDNNCTSYSASRISLTNISLDPALTSLIGGPGSFVSGQTQAIQFVAPGAGNQGQLGVTYDTYDWLKYDWDNDGVFDENPTAVATFGLFRGDDRFLHWRESL